jgi:hypothetical protein
MSIEIEFLFLPEAALRQAIEMCRAVSMEPQFFEGRDSECDSEVWSEILDKQKIDEETASSVLEMLQHAVSTLHKNLKSKIKRELMQFHLNVQPSKAGAFVVTETILESFQEKLLALIREQANRFANDDDFSGLSTVIQCQLTSSVQGWLPDLLPASGFDGFTPPRVDRLFGGNLTAQTSGFWLAEDIRAYSVGIEMFAKKIYEWQEAGSYPWKEFVETLSESTLAPVALVYTVKGQL